MKRLLLVLLLALPASAAAGPKDGSVSQRLSSGPVSVEFSYRESNGQISETRLTIARSGRALVDGALAWERTWLPGTLRLRSIDGDSEPELVLDYFSGGAYCCEYSLIYRYDPRSAAYVRLRHGWGTLGYRVVELHAGAPPVFVSADDRFDSAFGPHAVSVEPIRIWRYDGGRLVDVTRRFPGRIEADARMHWRLYLKVRKSRQPEVRGILAPWLADQILLGRAAQGWKALEGAYQRGELGRGRALNGYPAGRRYLASLRSFLRRAGYFS